LFRPLFPEGDVAWVETALVRRALISVSDKSSVLEFARGLHNLGIEILSTGGTAHLLRESCIPVIEVSDYTGFPEMMGGRVKTLHPKIHGGILARRNSDKAEMTAMGIAPIDLVAVNLYPFEQTISTPNTTLVDAIESIDIGGPAMLRAAAKNHAEVVVIVDCEDYGIVLNELETSGGVSDDTRARLAATAFSHTAQYDGTISNYLTGDDNDFPSTLNLQFKKRDAVRYGENPHQRAAFYQDQTPARGSLAAARTIQGKSLSFNNYADADAALECVAEFDETACVIVKHGNPCGVAIADDLQEAYTRAYETDPFSAFGGIIAFNRALDDTTAAAIIECQFVEVIIAPTITAKASEILAGRPNVRVLESATPGPHTFVQKNFKRVSGGLLVQDHDHGGTRDLEFEIVSQRLPTTEERRDLLFAWKVAKHVKSNAIVFAAEQRTIGVGAGQMSRVYSAKIASLKAHDQRFQVTGSVMASDAFFPFRDAIDTAAESGITAIIEPGGSLRDKEVIAAVNQHQMAMIFTGVRHFRH
jgi:phosphoribosylaminoimidazolecarboxamide formyltransferase/IMP cyclohydrolase